MYESRCLITTDFSPLKRTRILAYGSFKAKPKQLNPKDNVVLFYTNRYSDLPLVAKGAGAQMSRRAYLRILFARREFNIRYEQIRNNLKKK
ncbi:MAG: hypothetical protein H0V31_05090 [Acidobacteria bacterium]|nr:hypothetical protein [Acidobacteriota bacterium]